MLGSGYPAQNCTLARALEVVGERWTLLILRDAFYGVQRFSDFASHLDVPRAVLSERLSRLVEHGLLERQTSGQRRGQDFYRLTQSGRELWPALYALTRFGERFSHGGPPMRYVHAECASPLDLDGMCPTCHVAPPVADIATDPSRRATSTRTDSVAVALQRPSRLLTPIEPPGGE